MAASAASATDPDIIGTAWAAAAAGWLLAELIPVGVRVVLELAEYDTRDPLTGRACRLGRGVGLDGDGPPPTPPS